MAWYTIYSYKQFNTGNQFYPKISFIFNNKSRSMDDFMWMVYRNGVWNVSPPHICCLINYPRTTIPFNLIAINLVSIMSFAICIIIIIIIYGRIYRTVCMSNKTLEKSPAKWYPSAFCLFFFFVTFFFVTFYSLLYFVI